MYYGQTNTCDDRELRRQLDSERYERERLADQVRAYQEEREQRLAAARQEQRQRYAAYIRSADSWPDALAKQADLMSAESGLVEEDGSDWFADGAAACHKALELWHEEEAQLEPQLAQLRLQMAELRNGLRLRVADRLGDANQGTTYVADAIREFDEAAVSEWLNW